MKRAILSAVTAAMFFAACNDKEDLIPQNQVQDEQIVNEVIQSNVITLEEARKDLESLLKDFSSLSKRGGDDFSSKKISDGFTLKSDKRSISKSTEETPEAKIHVFNFENNGGFAIMSATRDMPELLAITEGGSIDTNQVIDDPGLITFLSGLEGKIKDPDYPVPDPGDIYPIEYRHEITSYSIYNPQGGYCRVKWGQDFPYNLLCPKISGEYALTGCVATACAQLMSIYSFPKEYNGYTFDWSKMRSGNDYFSIAYLMYLLGKKENLDMQYGLDGSGASPSNIIRTLINFGFYDEYLKFGAYDSTTVYSELKNGFPVLIGGFSDRVLESSTGNKVFGLSVDASPSYTYYGGHRWLLHGILVARENIKEIQYHKVISEYNRDIKYVLCNFGWDGEYDGYYWGEGFYPENKCYEDDFIAKKGFPYNITTVTGIRVDNTNRPLYPYNPY